MNTLHLDASMRELELEGISRRSGEDPCALDTLLMRPRSANRSCRSGISDRRDSARAMGTVGQRDERRSHQSSRPIMFVAGRLVPAVGLPNTRGCHRSSDADDHHQFIMRANLITVGYVRKASDRYLRSVMGIGPHTFRYLRDSLGGRRRSSIKGRLIPLSQPLASDRFRCEADVP